MRVVLSGVHGSDTRGAVGTLPVSVWKSSVDPFFLATTCASGTVAAVNDGAMGARMAMVWAPGTASTDLLTGWCREADTSPWSVRGPPQLVSAVIQKKQKWEK